MRTILVALAVALVTVSSSTAAFVVTSKTIKNGTIQLVDISPRAKKALRGQRGPSGIQEVTMVVTPPRVIPPGFPNFRVEATCPAGQRPISGGFQATGVPVITTSVANLSSNSWLVIGNSGPVAASLSAVAFCAINVKVVPIEQP